MRPTASSSLLSSRALNTVEEAAAKFTVATRVTLVPFVVSFTVTVMSLEL